MYLYPTSNWSQTHQVISHNNKNTQLCIILTIINIIVKHIYLGKIIYSKRLAQMSIRMLCLGTIMFDVCSYKFDSLLIGKQLVKTTYQIYFYTSTVLIMTNIQYSELT